MYSDRNLLTKFYIMKNITFILLFVSFISYAQDDLLKELNAQIKIDSTATSAFKGLKIVNLESTKLAARKDFYFVIAHRFGSVKGGFKELFGLDQSNIRFSFIFGLTDGFNIGAQEALSIRFMILVQNINC